MDYTFGSYLREKRTERMLKMNALAGMIGISAVYESYLETGKRSAPSEKVLNAIIKALELNPDEEETLLRLAAETHCDTSIPYDLIEYINNNKCVVAALRVAKDHDIPDETWCGFMKSIVNSAAAEVE